MMELDSDRLDPLHSEIPADLPVAPQALARDEMPLAPMILGGADFGATFHPLRHLDSLESDAGVKDMEPCIDAADFEVMQEQILWPV